ncbi:hypothetical protein NHX12_002964, partial [Muraenolepis orangiensis]
MAPGQKPQTPARSRSILIPLMIASIWRRVFNLSLPKNLTAPSCSWASTFLPHLWISWHRYTGELDPGYSQCAGMDTKVPGRTSTVGHSHRKWEEPDRE